MTLATPAVEAFLRAAIAQAKTPLPVTGRGYTVIKSVSATSLVGTFPCSSVFSVFFRGRGRLLVTRSRSFGAPHHEFSMTNRIRPAAGVVAGVVDI